MPHTQPPAVLVAAGGERWEQAALVALADAGITVQRRCVDLTDLLAAAATGHAQVALVSGTLTGLDHDAVVRLLRDDVLVVAVAEEAHSADLARIGVGQVLAPAEVDGVASVVQQVGRGDVVADPEPYAGPVLPVGGSTGRVVAVFGPTGAPGRTTLAAGLAAVRALAAPVVLVDADPYGGALGQHLGVLDEASGLLAAARLANNGALTAESFAGCRRRVSDGLDVVTGLPRPDRWVEVRAGALDSLLEQAAVVGDVVIDCGFCLEDDTDLGRVVGRNQLTLDAVLGADEVVVVGSAEPTGLARLARALVEITEVSPAPVRVVINRMRDTLGWSEHDIVGMVEGYVRPLGVHFLPEDRPSVDKLLVAGRALTESGEGPLRRAVTDVTAAVFRS